MEPPTWLTMTASATAVRTQLASATLATSSAIATLGAMEQASDPSESSGECQLLGPFSLLIQAALGGLALLSLVYKRWKERPQRPLKIWAFDVSKQVFGSVMLHLANLLLSMFSAGHFEIRQQYQPNPCSFYLLNLGIDVSSLSFISHPGTAACLFTCVLICVRRHSASRFSTWSSSLSTNLRCTLLSHDLPSLLNPETMGSLRR